jgi:hypothetical protein
LWELKGHKGVLPDFMKKYDTVEENTPGIGQLSPDENRTDITVHRKQSKSEI